MQMKGKDINKTILHQVLKTMSTTILLYFLYNHKDFNQGQNTMFIPRLIILFVARKLKRIANLINQPMQRESKVRKTE
jgi:hypothetical protein